MHLIHPLEPYSCRYRSCAFIDDIFGKYYSKGAGILNPNTWRYWDKHLGLLNLVMGIIGFAMQLAQMILARLGKFSRSINKNSKCLQLQDC